MSTNVSILRRTRFVLALCLAVPLASDAKEWSWPLHASAPSQELRTVQFEAMADPVPPPPGFATSNDGWPIERMVDGARVLPSPTPVPEQKPTSTDAASAKTGATHEDETSTALVPPDNSGLPGCGFPETVVSQAAPSANVCRTPSRSHRFLGSGLRKCWSGVAGCLGNTFAGNASGCGGCDCCSAGRPCCTPLITDKGGWLAWGWYGNSHGLSGQQGNAPLGFNNLAEEPQLHQAWLFLEREADNGGRGLAFGYRADMLFGSDAPDTQAFGDGTWDEDWDTSSQYGFALPQLYATVAINDWSLKVGRFYTIIGYEVVQAPDNFFYSKPYTMYYNEPFTHTGFLIERSLTERLTLVTGWTLGWDTGYRNPNDGLTSLSGITWSPTDNLSFAYAFSWGDPGDDPVGDTDVWMHSLVMNATLGKWNYIFHHDFQTRRPAAAVGPAFKQYGINQYLIRPLTERLSAGIRQEWFYAGENVGPPLGAAASTPGSHYHATSIGLNFRRGNFLVKPEIRYDWVDFDGAVGDGRFDQRTRLSQFTYGFQTIYTF